MESARIVIKVFFYCSQLEAVSVVLHSSVDLLVVSILRCDRNFE